MWIKEMNKSLSCLYHVYSRTVGQPNMTQICRNISNTRLPSKSTSPVNDAIINVTKPYKTYRLDTGPRLHVKVAREEALRYYRQMKVIRCMETAALNLHEEKQIHGVCHLYTGQEAVCVGMEAGIMGTDSVITSYRVHGWAYVRGAAVSAVLSELTGKSTGCSKGRGGSMHMYGTNLYGGCGIVGAQVPLGAGLAFAHKYTGSDNICMALYGDGAANQGQLFEAFNIAKLWDLPVVFVCENNGYGMGTSVERASASTEYYTRGDYIPGLWVDGMDILAVQEATRWAAEYCRSGKGPLVMECETYRFCTHKTSDTNVRYRSHAEVQKVQETNDPITSLKRRIIAADLTSSEELEAIDENVTDEVEDAVFHAKSDPEPDVTNLYSHVYCDPLPGHTVRRCDLFTYQNKTPVLVNANLLCS